MQLNYIILAHKSPLQLKSLLESLSSDISSFYIHIDLKSDIRPFLEHSKGIKNVHFIEERENTLWGDFSLVQATLNCINAIKSLKTKGHTVLLSGQDKPLQSQIDIKNFFGINENNDFITTFNIPYKHWNNNGLDRLNNYNFHTTQLGRDHISIPHWTNNFFYKPSTLKHYFYLFKYFPIKHICKTIIRRRKPEYIKKWHGGSQWWALTNKTIKGLMVFIEKNPSFIEYNKFTHIPDEIFFQTLVQHINIDENSVKPSITYVNWSRKNCDLPVTFTDSEMDVKELKNIKSDFLFARKFDESSDNSLIKMINNV